MKRVTGNRHIGSRSNPIVLLSYTSCRTRLQWVFADLQRKTRYEFAMRSHQEIRRGPTYIAIRGNETQEPGENRRDLAKSRGRVRAQELIARNPRLGADCPQC